MSVVISDDLLLATHMTEVELKQELAVLLYQKEKLTLAQASELADLTRLEFQHLLASRGFPIHFSIAELEADLRTLRELGQR